MNRATDKPNGRDQNLAKNFRALLFAAMICVGLFTSAAFAAGAWPRIVTFDAPNSKATLAFGITSAGMVVGEYEDSNGVLHGFTYDTFGNFVTLDAHGAGTGSGQGTRPLSVSPSGEICGIYIDQFGHDQGFFLNTSGTYTTLNIAGEVEPPFPTSVNDNAQVVGVYDDSNFQTVGFLWTSNSSVTTFDPLNATNLEGALINGSGQIAGYFDNRVKRRGYFRDVGGAITVFDGSPSATATFVEGFNDSGAITGFYVDTNGWNGFVRQGTTITRFQVEGSALTQPTAINRGGTVAGIYVDGSDVNHGFTRDRLGNVTLIDVPYAGTGVNQGTLPTSINASGQVAGFFVGPLGNYHGFVRR